MSRQERIELRIFYWAAFNGFKKPLRYMIESRKWSPFIKSYKNRSIVSGAVWGSQVDTVRMMLGDYTFENIHPTAHNDFAKSLFNKDLADNNCLHYTYMIDLPEIRQILRDNGFFNERSQRLNRRGQLPTKLRHYHKAEDSNEDTSDEELYDKQQAEADRQLQNVGGLDLMIQGTAIDIESNAKVMKKQESIVVEELLAGKSDFDL